VVFVPETKTGHPAAAHSAEAVVLRAGADGLQTLLWTRQQEPFAGRWALPGGYLAPGESLEASARRHLSEKVGVREVGYLEQLETRSEPTRDPRGWTVTTAYLALVDAGQPIGAPADAAWWAATDPPPLAFDHTELVALAVARLRAKLTYSNIARGLVPDVFAIADLRRVYAAVLGYDVSPSNLQRVLERGGLLEPTGERRPSGRNGGRPAELFRFGHPGLAISRPLAAFRPRQGT